MPYSRGTKVSSLSLNDTQHGHSATVNNRKRMSHMELPMSVIKSRMSIIGKKTFNVRGGRGETEELQQTFGGDRGKSFDINLPRRQCLEPTAREFPQNWQTTLGPARSCLRRNESEDRQNPDDKHRRSRSSQIWPTSLGSRSKFVRLIVVASPSLQRLSHRV